MKLHLKTMFTGKLSTLGQLMVDGQHECFTCEDTEQDEKVPGETRIPAGTYKIELRNEGRMTQRYAMRFANHKGMLWLRDVPGFEWVYIHIGNTHYDTKGCILVGQHYTHVRGDGGFVTSSTLAYMRLYEKVSSAILRGEGVEITVERS